MNDQNRLSLPGLQRGSVTAFLNAKTFKNSVVVVGWDGMGWDGLGF